MELDKVLGKIKKILRLSKDNPSEEEALTAAKMARNLLAKYSLSMSDIDLDNDGRSSDMLYMPANNNKGVKVWEGALAHIMSEFVPVRAVIFEVCKVNKRGKHRTIHFIGNREDVVVAIEMYRYLRSTIKKMARKHYKVKKLIKSYATGAVDRLCHRFKEMKEDSKKEDDLEGKYELVVADKLVKADQFIEEELNTRKPRSRRLSLDDEAVCRGYHEAGLIGLDLQLTNT